MLQVLGEWKVAVAEVHDLLGVEVGGDGGRRTVVQPVVTGHRIVPEQVAVVGCAGVLDGAARKHVGNPSLVPGVGRQNVPQRGIRLLGPFGRGGQPELLRGDPVDDGAQRGIRLKEQLCLLHARDASTRAGTAPLVEARGTSDRAGRALRAIVGGGDAPRFPHSAGRGTPSTAPVVEPVETRDTRHGTR
ncbi:hypothetical protein JF66_12035 [Cryobacterium sp. MLB-32]|nr:hypothetical protein JF66_12035 [Cryobacterium sp. MLB-32]